MTLYNYLNINSMNESEISDLKSLDFFQECTKELKQIAFKSKFDQTTQRKLKNIRNINKKQTESIDEKLLQNIVIDFLRSKNYNHSYSVFMSQSHLLSSEIISKKMLSDLIKLEKQYNDEERYNISILQIQTQKLKKILEDKPIFQENGAQVQIFTKDMCINNFLLAQNRIKEVRKEVEDREKKYYETLLSQKKNMIYLEMRQQLHKQEQKKYQQEKQLLKAKEIQLQAKKNSEYQKSDLLSKNQQLLNQNSLLKQSISQMKQKIKKLNKDLIIKQRKQNEECKVLAQSLKKEKKQVEQKKIELEMALRNLNTKVQDLIQQKQKITNKTQTDNFQKQVRIHKQNKDYMIETLYGELKQMEYRVKSLSEDKEKNKMLVKALEKKVEELSDQAKKQNSIDTELEKLQKEKKFKLKTINVGVGVNQSEFQPNYPSESEESEQQGEIRALESKNKIAKMHTDLKLLKNQVRIFVKELE